MIIFISSTILILLMLLEKYYFYAIEKAYAANFWARLDLFGLTIIFILGFLTFIFSKKEKLSLRFRRPKKIQIIAGILVLITIAYSVFLNLNKKSLEWDAVALYDARAKMLEAGDTFSDMVKYSKYDQITYYYLMYPPYTSIAHYFIRIITHLPIQVFYASYLVMLAVIVYGFCKKYFGTTIGLFSALIVILNKDILMSSILEYTNLPYTTAMVVGICLLFDYLRNGSWWKYFYAVAIISTTSWIRFLEPVWLVVLIPFAVALLVKKLSTKNILLIILFAAICGLEYFCWAYFTANIAANPASVGFNIVQLMGMVAGIFTGNLFFVAKNFIKWLFVPLLMYGVVIISGLRIAKILIKNPNQLFLFLIIPLSLGLYLTATYFSSFQGVWWLGLGGSIVRSSAFLLPTALFNILFLSEHQININRLKKLIDNE